MPRAYIKPDKAVQTESGAASVVNPELSLRQASMHATAADSHILPIPVHTIRCSAGWPHLDLGRFFQYLIIEVISYVRRIYAISELNIQGVLLILIEKTECSTRSNPQFTIRNPKCGYPVPAFYWSWHVRLLKLYLPLLECPAFYSWFYTNQRLSEFPATVFRCIQLYIQDGLWQV